MGKRFHNPGDQVEATASDPVLRVIDPTRLQVDASVAIADLPAVMVGALGPGDGAADLPPLPMKVGVPPRSVEPGTAAAPVRLTFSVVSNLAVGTPVQVGNRCRGARVSCSFQPSRFVREGEETAVFIAAGKKAQRRAVVLGIVERITPRSSQASRQAST